MTAWLESPDDPDTWGARYEAWAVEADLAVAVGTSRHVAMADHPERLYQNAFLMHFDAEGRCSELTEFFMREPS